MFCTINFTFTDLQGKTKPIFFFVFDRIPGGLPWICSIVAWVHLNLFMPFRTAGGCAVWVRIDSQINTEAQTAPFCLETCSLDQMFNIFRTAIYFPHCKVKDKQRWLIFLVKENEQFESFTKITWAWCIVADWLQSSVLVEKRNELMKYGD